MSLSRRIRYRYTIIYKQRKLFRLLPILFSLNCTQHLDNSRSDSPSLKEVLYSVTYSCLHLQIEKYNMTSKQPSQPAAKGGLGDLSLQPEDLQKCNWDQLLDMFSSALKEHEQLDKDLQHQTVELLKVIDRYHLLSLLWLIGFRG